MNNLQLMKKIVIYTSIIGDYDILRQPNIIDEDFDYICFVKNGTKNTDTIGIWRIVELPVLSESEYVISRYPKLNPHLVLPNYDYSLWIDGNIIINHCDIYKIIKEKVKKGILYSGIHHWSRNCIYDEAKAIIYTGKDSICNVLKTIKFLSSMNYPQNFGLSENNVILRKHNDKQVKYLDGLWWDLFMKYSKRDQMTFGYCIYKSDIKWDYLLPVGFTARNHYTFKALFHSNLKQKSSFQKMNKYIGGKLRMFYFTIFEQIIIKFKI